jgi:hypothetical protein
MLDVRQIGQEEAEVHGIAPGVTRHAIQRKPEDLARPPINEAATEIYALPSHKGKV